MPSQLDGYVTDVEVPRPDLAANVTADKVRRKGVRRLGYAAVATGVLAFAAVSGGSDSATTSTAVQSTDDAGPKTESLRSLTEWLGGDGTVESWLSTTSTDNAWIYHWLISLPDGLYTASVTVVDGSAYSQPSITPYLEPPLADIPEWPGDPVVVDKPASFDSAVEQWVLAYTSGDPERLRQTVADPSPDHFYIPMSGWTVDSVTVSGAVSLDGKVLARVTFTISSGEISLKQALDVLVTQANTATPRVVAWGPAMSGPELSPYQNAISENRTTAKPLNTPPTQPTTTTTTTTTTTAPPPETAPPAPTPAPVPEPAPAPAP